MLDDGELLVDTARMHGNVVAPGANGVLNLGRGHIGDQTVSLLVREADR